MIIIEPQVEMYHQKPGMAGVYEAIAFAARVCTQVNEKPHKLSDEDFVKGLIAKGHMRPLEFGTMYYKIPDWELCNTDIDPILEVIENSELWSRVFYDEETCSYYVTTNYRFIIDHFDDESRELLDKFYCEEPTEHHEKRYSLVWTVGRDINDEFRTHVGLSSLMSSTRYVSYKHHVGYVQTQELPLPIGVTSYSNLDDYDLSQRDRAAMIGLLDGEKRYFYLIDECGVKSEIARKFLPFNFVSQMIQCGFYDDMGWKNFFDQRAFNRTGKAHPDAEYIAKKGYELLQKSM